MWAAFICGVGITVANLYLNFFSSSIVAGAFSMLFGLVVVPVVSLLTPRPEEKRVEDLFFSMEEWSRNFTRTERMRVFSGILRRIPEFLFVGPVEGAIAGEAAAQAGLCDRNALPDHGAGGKQSFFRKVSHQSDAGLPAEQMHQIRAVHVAGGGDFLHRERLLEILVHVGKGFLNQRMGRRGRKRRALQKEIPV